MTLTYIIFLIYNLRLDKSNLINKDKNEIIKNDATFMEPDDRIKKSKISSIEMIDISDEKNIKGKDKLQNNNIFLVVKENVEKYI